MAKLEEFYTGDADDEKLTRKAAANLGLQESVEGTATWVFNERFEIVVERSEVKNSHSKYIWIGSKYRGKPSPYIAPANLRSTARPCQPGESPVSTLFTAILKTATSNSHQQSY